MLSAWFLHSLSRYTLFSVEVEVKESDIFSDEYRNFGTICVKVKFGLQNYSGTKQSHFFCSWSQKEHICVHHIYIKMHRMVEYVTDWCWISSIMVEFCVYILVLAFSSQISAAWSFTSFCYNVVVQSWFSICILGHAWDDS